MPNNACEAAAQDLEIFLKRGAGNTILNTQCRTASAIFSAFNLLTGVTLLP